MIDSVEERDRREAESYADEAMTQANEAWQLRFGHITSGPTTRRGWDVAYGSIAARLGDGGRVLDVGCGPGHVVLVLARRSGRTWGHSAAAHRR